jgi:DNA polymerase-3 subunit alpha
MFSYEEKYDSTPSFSFRKTLQLEKIVMGYYFYQHPTDEHKNDMQSISATLPKNLTFRNNKVFLYAYRNQINFDTRHMLHAR